jgi:ubiquinone/menaquinone biosynthesis C-methylase UbiE
MSAIEQRILEKTWFYRFHLPGGEITSTYDDGALDGIHTSRLAMLQQVIDSRFGGSLAGSSAIDIACHQGWFATKLAQWNADDVLAIDARAEHVADTTLIRDALNLSKLRVQQSDVHALQPANLGTFDLVLMLGLIYHLENPIGALRQARALTRQACVVETQIIPGMTGMVDYGSYRFVRPLKGSFGIIDETDDTHGPEASTTGICLVPSLEALIWIMRKVGFARVEVIAPPADAYEQLLHGKRVMVVGYID